MSLHLRIFLASPGDVADERALALRVLEELQYDPLLRGRITVETVAWDKPGAGAPMRAMLTPQEAINKELPTPAECDIVVVVFWSRMGTPLPADWPKPGGGRYLSGTEWEYRNALAVAESQGKPEILVYRRTAKIVLDPDDPEFDEKSQQWRLVEQFFHSFKNPDGSLRRGYNPYATPDEFRERLTLHLRTLVRELLEREGPITPASPVAPAPAATAPPLWEGSPFPGLRAFTPADAPIFFGRGRETDGLIHRLEDPQVRFLAVVGASGSGKSSLVAAGLIPRLLAGALPGSQDWGWVRFTPGEVGDNPFVALAVPFKDALQQRGQSPRELAEQMATNPAALTELRDLALAGKPDWAEWLLFVDQFEELFTLAAPSYVAPFVAWLGRAAQTERIRVVATLRADFYHRCVEQPMLAELLRTGSYPLAAPRPGALREMINRPAERAGLTFEEGLAEQMLDDTGAGPGALALLAFALEELYHARTPAGLLTQVAYDGFHGVQGAIAQRAETTVSQLGLAPATVGEVFQELVEIEDSGAVTRRRAPWAQVVKSAEAERLVTAFVEARLLVASGEEGGPPVVEIAHEALFTAWKTLTDWLDKHREQLKAGQYLEEAAKEWQALGEHGAALASGTRLRRYRQAINPSALARRFMHASQWRLWIKRGMRGLVTAVVLVGAGWLYGVGMAERLVPMLLDTAGLSDFKEPEMISVHGGEFWMGSRDDDAEAYDAEKPRHRVTIKAFELGRYEVTFEEYDLFAHARGLPLPPDQGWGRGRRPVINVTWRDAVAYADWLSWKTGKPYRLPTEAEWEYAARAGTETMRFWGNDPHQACRYANGADDRFRKMQGAREIGGIHECDDGQVLTAEVGSYEANQFGLYDMLGNVWEWTCSAYEEKYQGQENVCINNNDAGGPRVVRGGSWYGSPRWLRAAFRNGYAPDYRVFYGGFRLARTFPF